MYQTQDIKTMIFEYNWRKNVLLKQGYEYDSNSTAQYGVDSVMPKAQGSVGDKVSNIVIGNSKIERMYYKHVEVVDFIDSYEQYIDNDKNFNILQLLKDNVRKKEIQEIFDIGQTNLDNRIDDIIRVLYQHQSSDQYKQSHQY